MAERLYTKAILNDDEVRITWAGIEPGDTCNFCGELAEYDDRSAQVEGTFGGATVSVQGSLDGSNFRTLNDPFGSALDFLAAKIRVVTEYVALLKPAITGGAGASLAVTVLAKRKRK